MYVRESEIEKLKSAKDLQTFRMLTHFHGSYRVRVLTSNYGWVQITFSEVRDPTKRDTYPVCAVMEYLDESSPFWGCTVNYMGVVKESGDLLLDITDYREPRDKKEA